MQSLWQSAASATKRFQNQVCILHTVNNPMPTLGRYEDFRKPKEFLYSHSRHALAITILAT